ncbi:hypothetical protein LINPERHAP1_LOCUS15956 [Linum perenne]
MLSLLMFLMLLVLLVDQMLIGVNLTKQKPSAQMWLVR